MMNRRDLLGAFLALPVAARLAPPARPNGPLLLHQFRRGEIVEVPAGVMVRMFPLASGVMALSFSVELG